MVRIITDGDTDVIELTDNMMKAMSFRTIIIMTIILVITVFSIIAFTVFSIFLKDKVLTSTELKFNQMNLLREQYYFVIDQDDGSIIKSMLKTFEKDKNVLKTYIVNSDSKVVYPDDYSALKGDTLIFDKLFSQDKDISIKNYPDEQVPYDRVFFTMRNTPSCYSCHDSSGKNLGIIVMDLLNEEAHGIIGFTRLFGFSYTLFILIFIFTLVGYLHYKYIRKSLYQFRYKMSLINKGNLGTRLVIPEFRELGKLGTDFNFMMDTFEKTQLELQEYHRKELRHSEKLATIGEMSARIAHEIRNPITGISRAMEIIISEMKDSENILILEEVQRQANRVNDAISNLLKYSRSKDVLLEQGDINEVIKSLTFFLRNQAGNKIIDFKLELNAEVPKIDFDHELIENVLMNLSCNAIQSIKETGTIHFMTSVDYSKNMVIVSVKDSGNGIPSEIGKDIFKPFYTTRTKGTGLGLAISKDIIEKHHGELWFENNVDSGCTFYISLPI